MEAELRTIVLEHVLVAPARAREEPNAEDLLEKSPVAHLVARGLDIRLSRGRGNQPL
jgi:hypothetical protein